MTRRRLGSRAAGAGGGGAATTPRHGWYLARGAWWALGALIIGVYAGSVPYHYTRVIALDHPAIRDAAEARSPSAGG